jgi:Zn-dependent peptidase ImmA (M78 family)
MERVQIKPNMIRWAVRRSGRNEDDLYSRFPINKWEEGTKLPTLKQLERFALNTSTPIGYLFLSKPPEEKVPIPDYRKIKDSQDFPPSPDLLETIYICQQRQEWYRDYAKSIGEEPPLFVGKTDINDNIIDTAADIRRTLEMDIEARKKFRTWTDALSKFIERADKAGILVMVSGIVGTNTGRKLNPLEFRGFALSDKIAPLVFINGADTKAAQMFTIAHELAHIWIDSSALSDVDVSTTSSNKTEQWCNEIAAELLVPIEIIKREYQKDQSLHEEMNRLAKRFKVSSLVALRRIYDAGGIDKKQMWETYFEELNRLKKMPVSSGGNFYLTQTARVGRRFAQAIAISTLEGQTLYTDAFQLLGFSKLETFKNLAHHVGVY